MTEEVKTEEVEDQDVELNENEVEEEFRQLDLEKRGTIKGSTKEKT